MCRAKRKFVVIINRCFDESVYNEFNEYSKKIKDGIVYVTPTIRSKHTDDKLERIISEQFMCGA